MQLFVLNLATCKLNGRSNVLPSSVYWLLFEDFWMSAYNQHNQTFSWEIKVFLLCLLLVGMWLSGQGFGVILLSGSFKRKLRYYVSVSLIAFARFCLWECMKLHFPWICCHEVLWPLSAASSVPYALKGGHGTASCSPARRVLEARPAGKNTFQV